MKPDTFRTQRPDGRSDAQVIIDLAASYQPGDTLPYDALGAALSYAEGPDYSHARIGAAVRRAYRRLLREQARALHVVPTIGYRVAQAREHNTLAHQRQNKADTQLRIGLDTLKHVRWSDLSPNERAAHEGTLMILSAVIEQTRGIEQRQKKLEDALAKMTRPD